MNNSDEDDFRDEDDLIADETAPEEEAEQVVYEHFHFKADPKQGPTRVDLYVMDRIEKATRNKVQNGIKEGLVKVNGEVVKANYKVRPGDEIIVYWTKPKEAQELIAEDIPLDIRYEDDDVLVLYKPAGMVAHPAIGHFSGTLANALAFRFQQMPLLNSFHPDRPGLVHRIDKNTTGLLLIAKTDAAMANLAKQFFHHTVYRRYIALVWGDFDEDEGTVNAYMGRDPNYRKLRAVVEDPTQGKYAVTHWTVLKRYGYVTLVECRLETGRTHQIRVHMKHIGHPLFNDSEYGGDRVVYGTVHSRYKQFIQNCFEMLPHHALHARTIGFKHPTTGEYIQVDCDLPDYFQATLDKWEKYVGGRTTNLG